MSRETEFRNAGSNVGATIRQSLRMLAGQDVPNYTLVFLDPTKQNARGESKNMVVPYVVFGRGSSCNIQYGDEYGTVSRQHCSIKVDETGCTLIHNPEATNPTLVDGKPIQGSYKLISGDEIQLAYEGPKIRFLTDRTQKTSTMGFTRRMSIAVAQSLRPYRRALAIVGLLLFLAIGYSVWSTYQLKALDKKHAELAKEMQLSDERIQAQEVELITLQNSGQANEQRIAAALNALNQERARRSETQSRMQEVEIKIKETGREVPQVKSSNQSDGNQAAGYEENKGGYRQESTGDEASGALDAKELELIEKSIYYISVDTMQIVDPDVNGAVYNSSLKWGGTGFLTSDGKFITARHVIEPWLFLKDDCDPLIILNDFISKNGKVDIVFKATSSGGEDSFTFTNTQTMTYHDGNCETKVYSCSSRKKFKNTITARICEDIADDWVYIPMGNIPSKLVFNRELSKNLDRGESLHILGFGLGLHVQKGYSTKFLDPLYSQAIVGQKGIVNGTLTATNISWAGGSSGGPVFVKRNGEFIVIGLISSSAHQDTCFLAY